jgi:acetate kinase
MHVLVFNCGSTSLKYELFEVEGSGPSGFIRSLRTGKVDRLAAGASSEAVEWVIGELKDAGLSVDAVGHRVVHGGETFSDAVLIDDDVLAGIEACVPLAPLHNPANLAGIRAAQAGFPGVPQVAVFDTAFHASLPRRARTYALPQDLAAEHGLRRYGFHGPSHAFVSREACRYLGASPEALRLITCHLGGGASVCAVEFGTSVETSMGTTPLEGLVMGTRSGDIDPGALLLLLQRGAVDVDGLDELLNRRSGLAGLSGVGPDLRDIEERAAAGDDAARLAIAVFAHRVRKYIGAYAATMGGVDAVVLTGGIGENAVGMRRRILQRFDFLGLILDDDRNEDARVGDDARTAEISAPHSRVKALVVATDEERMIAEETRKVVAGLTAPRAPRPIPISVSARHVHLNLPTFEALFGEGATLTHRNDLSQPGIFAAEETVTLHGPRRSIEGVRLLGPLRGRNQVEISRTDEFRLGVDAPVRASGKVEGSAPITVEGPRGKRLLQEGLICAWRHIHMRPEDAADFGVEHGDSVEVAIVGGDRDLVFGDVTIRVSPEYALEMHIDTDEANAAELGRTAQGVLVRSDTAQALVRSRKPKAR